MRKFVLPSFCHSCGSRACPALDAGNPGFPVKTGTQFHTFLVPCIYRNNVWAPAFAGVT